MQGQWPVAGSQQTDVSCGIVSARRPEARLQIDYKDKLMAFKK
jgi:hypothetical protein